MSRLTQIQDERCLKERAVLNNLKIKFKYSPDMQELRNKFEELPDSLILLKNRQTPNLLTSEVEDILIDDAFQLFDSQLRNDFSKRRMSHEINTHSLDLAFAVSYHFIEYSHSALLVLNVCTHNPAEL